MEPGKPLTTIGWRETVALPDWRIARIRAKIDTGARTSAIHVAAIEELPGERVRFKVVLREKPARKTRWVEAPIARRTVVKPSSGDRQSRIVCSTRMVLGGVEREVEVSLVCRQGMLCRMLVGRRAIAGAFLVDASRKYIITGRAAHEPTGDPS